MHSFVCGCSIAPAEIVEKPIFTTLGSSKHLRFLACGANPNLHSHRAWAISSAAWIRLWQFSIDLITGPDTTKRSPTLQTYSSLHPPTVAQPLTYPFVLSTNHSGAQWLPSLPLGSELWVQSGPAVVFTPSAILWPVMGPFRWTISYQVNSDIHCFQRNWCIVC